MNQSEKAMKHIVENGVHWPRKSLSGKSKSSGGVGKPTDWFKGNVGKSAMRPQHIGRQKKKSY